jgi:Cytochrome c7 and related cytochrome c
MGDRFGHKGHLVRVGVLFLGGIALFLVVQALLVPKDFGVYGHYRAGALDDNRARPLIHAGRAACVECHGDVAEALSGGHHKGVGCEACHGPLARHAEDPSTQEAVKPDSRGLCPRCHQANVARPAGFPQIDVSAHAGVEACTSCHAAHDPTGEEGATP